MTEFRHQNLRDLGAPEILLRYLDGDPEIEAVLGHRPRSVADFDSIPRTVERAVPREKLVAALSDYADRHGAPTAVFDALKTFEDESVQVIVTGQQPGLLGGPLYTLHKAATALRLARELTAAGRPTLALFWNHSDDHDFDEVNRAFLINRNLDLQRFRLDIDPEQAAIRDVPVGQQLDAVVDAANDLLPGSEFRDEVLEACRSRDASEGLGAQLARLLFRCFGNQGLLILEPRDLPEEAFDVLPRWRGKAGEIREQVRRVTDHLTDLGIDVTIDPSVPLMFECGGAGPRRALADDEAPSEGRRLSPSVLLRPLWQDLCLPTIGFVVGPGELSYLSVVSSLYRLLGVPRPLLVPRASLTLTTGSLEKHRDRLGFDLAELRRGSEDLLAGLQNDGDDRAEQSLRLLAETVQSELGAVRGLVLESDRALQGPIDKSKQKICAEIEKLEQKVRNARQNREGSGERQVKRLCSTLAPRGRMQERVLGPLSFLVTHGFGLGDVLVEHADPFTTEHGLLQL
ncbi:MAG: bacillithiol biosynthesis BshC [Planctomycetota bacterium]